MPSVTKATPVKAGGVRNSTGRATPPGTKPVPNKAHSTASTHQLPTAVKPATKNAVVVKAGKTPSVAVKKSASSRQVSPIPKSLGGARKPPTAVNSSSAIVKKKAAITNSQGGYYDQAMDIYSQVSSGNGGNFLNQKYVQKPFAAAGDKVANGINWVGSTVTGVGSTIKNGSVSFRKQEYQRALLTILLQR